jgi:hypothetical protein
VVVVAAVVAFSLPAVATADPADNGTTEREARPHRVGSMIDVGFPEGAGLSLVVRPAPWARLHAGPTFNLVAPGLRGGVTFDPMATVVGVSGTVEGGYVFPGDYSSLPGKEAPYLHHVSYGYLNLHLGIEVGNRDVLRLFLRGGLSLASASLSDLQPSLQNQERDTTITASDPKVTISPFFSGKAGAAVFF